MIGVARAVSGLFDLPLNLPNPGPANGDRANLPELNIEIRDPSLSARYSAGYLHDLSIGPSPYWMQRRLEAAGVDEWRRGNVLSTTWSILRIS